MPALTNEELLSFEAPIELGFVKLLADRGLTFYESRSVLEAETPWGEVSLNTGATSEHKHNAINGRGIHDFWVSQIEFTIRTSREYDSVNPQGRQHKRMIGKVRALCSMPVIAAEWMSTDAGDLYAIADIRETGSSRAVDEDNKLDITTISFSIKHNARPDAWPV